MKFAVTRAPEKLVRHEGAVERDDIELTPSDLTLPILKGRDFIVCKASRRFLQTPNVFMQIIQYRKKFPLADALREEMNLGLFNFKSSGAKVFTALVDDLVKDFDKSNGTSKVKLIKVSPVLPARIESRQPVYAETPGRSNCSRMRMRFLPLRIDLTSLFHVIFQLPSQTTAGITQYYGLSLPFSRIF